MSITIPDVQKEEIVWRIIEQGTKNELHQLIMEILYSTGMRVGALLGLRVEDVVQNSANHDEHVIHRSKGRNGGKSRRFFMLPRTLSKLMAFISKWGLSSDDLIFTMTASCIQKFVKAAVVEVLGEQVGKKFHPHLFRHHFATHWYGKALSNDMLRQLMGHASFKTTK